MTNIQYLSDCQLVTLLRENENRKAFETLYNRYWKKLLILARCKTGSEQEAEEIVQQVFLNIWKMRKELHIRNTFHTYIASCVKYEILATLSRQQKYQNAVNTLSGNPTADLDNQTSEWLDYSAVRQQLEQTVRSLPEKCQLVFRLSRESGYSEKQIADVMSISRKTVQAHMSKALKVLKGRLLLPR
ncbi:RNA polymerase sigma-70 factor [Flavihumibacter solisilvae]|uniref:HTH luxR-type domain-containing protein n=1 Tax=Flavihumibacter solisilvae TaxID=1349421 RepID=A0A0C1KYA7_9BACT|nr:RNA polymerase sigma-70 factor [Flavihumibacter solisilvae]KIC92692.1 hypothetical protein OI18_21460 [Flavihumibacter solisilvae]